MDPQCLEEVRPKIVTYIKNIFRQENPSLDESAYTFDVEGDGPFHIIIKNKNDAEESVTLKLKPFEFICSADGNTYIIEFGTPKQSQEGGKRRRRTYKRVRRSSRKTRRNV